jgi:hypothetical protein
MKVLDVFIRICVCFIFASTFYLHFYLQSPPSETTMISLLDSKQIHSFRAMYGSYNGAELWSFGRFVHKGVHFVAGDLHDAFQYFLKTSHSNMLVVWVPFPVINFDTPSVNTVVEYRRQNKTLATLWNKETANRYAFQKLDWRRWCQLEQVQLKRVFV